MENSDAPTYACATAIFLRLLAVIYAIAFASLAVQIKGLVGRNGILPVADVLRPLTFLRRRKFFQLPTVFWWNDSDRALSAVCAAGFVSALLLLAGVAPVPLLALLWLLYLSLVTVGRQFLNYQWDMLLLETGFLALWLAPWEWFSPWPPAHDPPAIARWLCGWLLFRLMLSAGLVKWANGDATWRNLTALCHHYETQPLPTRLAWHLHKLPRWFHRASAAFIFTIELGCPWLLLAPAPVSYAAGLGIILLMLLIMATGSYGFFTLNVLALCALLFDDVTIAATMNALVPGTVSAQPAATGAGWPAWVLMPVAAGLVLLSLVQLHRQFARRWTLPSALLGFVDRLAPFHLINAYGLFSLMTTWRNEIIIEGSDDGVTWRAYEFKWNPGDVRRAPRSPAPHQPRLDWQMWFAAAGQFAGNLWVHALLNRLAQGSPEVQRLFRTNPFPDHPPRHVRARVFEYRFTNRATRAQTGAWWTRELKGAYGPVVDADWPVLRGKSSR